MTKAIEYKCPYRENNSCTHKDRRLNNKGVKRACGFLKCPENCVMYLDYIERIDMDYLEKESLREASMGFEGGLR